MVTTPDEERDFWGALDPHDRFSHVCSDESASYGFAQITMGLRPEPGEVLVDLGCGPGRLAIQLLRTGVGYIGVDIWPSALGVVRNEIEAHGFENAARVARCDGRTIPLTDGSADGLFSMLLFQHLHADTVAGYLTETARVLRTEGRFVVQWVEGTYGDVAYNYPYPPGAIAGMCIDAGLTVDAETGDPKYPTWRWTRGHR